VIFALIAKIKSARLAGAFFMPLWRYTYSAKDAFIFFIAAVSI
jgi:hypothetical protein